MHRRALTTATDRNLSPPISKLTHPYDESKYGLLNKLQGEQTPSMYEHSGMHTMKKMVQSISPFKPTYGNNSYLESQRMDNLLEIQQSEIDHLKHKLHQKDQEQNQAIKQKNQEIAGLKEKLEALFMEHVAYQQQQLQQNHTFDNMQQQIQRMNEHHEHDIVKLQRSQQHHVEVIQQNAEMIERELERKSMENHELQNNLMHVLHALRGIENDNELMVKRQEELQLKYRIMQENSEKEKQALLKDQIGKQDEVNTLKQTITELESQNTTYANEIKNLNLKVKLLQTELNQVNEERMAIEEDMIQRHMQEIRLFDNHLRKLREENARLKDILTLTFMK